MQDQLRDACKRSILFWINAFVWTFRQKITMPDGRELPVSGANASVPFITWMVQDEAILDLQYAIEHGEDRGIIKARDMGATWVGLMVILHDWLFGSNATYKLLSRKEDLVDKHGDMDALIPKLRFVLEKLPGWMMPSTYEDKLMMLRNNDAANVIVGESTNQHAGQGGRNKAIFVDEFGRMDNGEEIELSTADTTSCRIFNSTPSGPGTGFHKLYRSRRCKFMEMPWWRHPEKGYEAHQVRDEIGRPKWTNAWYEGQAARRSKKDLAQNIDMNFGEAGDTFFDIHELDNHRASYVCEPSYAGRLLWAGDYGPDKINEVVRRKEARGVYFDPSGKGLVPKWRFWLPLIDGRPPQEYTYVFGIDISNGSGGSNSVITVRANEIDQIVAKFWDSFVSPEDLAEQAAMAGIWFGGLHPTKLAYVVWENNGPGGIFGRKLVKMGYGNYYSNKVDDIVRAKKTERWGWHSNKKKKEVLLGRYREDLKLSRTINPCEESLAEAADYIYGDDGELVPGKLRQEKAGGRALHGDHVIADALTVLGRDELPKVAKRTTQADKGTFAHRRHSRQLRAKAGSEWGR